MILRRAAKARSARAAFVAAGLALLALLLCLPAQAGAAAKIEGGRLFRVVQPRDDQLMRGGRLSVRLRTGRDVRLISAELNGRDVRGLFRRRAPGALVATLRARRLRRALPPGRNFIRFVVRRGKRGRKDYETVAFTRARPGRKLIRRFRAGFRPSKGLRVTLVPARLSTKLRVTLNGHDVSRQFRRGRPLRRLVRLGASDGLHHGRNRLRILASDFHGRYTTRVRTIRVARRTALAGAGPDRRLAAGAAVRLDGRASRAARRGRGGRLRYRWKLIRRPRGSRARLTARRSRRPILRTDAPGAYRVQLQASQGGAVTDAVDEAEVSAEAQPEVPIDTLATVDGQSGIEVEVDRDCQGAKAAVKPPCFYPNQGKGSDLQVVVLDRATLEPIEGKANTSYETTELAGFEKEMAEFVHTPEGSGCPVYDSDKLVILALREGDLPGEAAFADALKPFSTQGCKPSSSSWPSAAPFSIIAVPGMLAGRAWVNDGRQIAGPEGSAGTAGSLEGVLEKTLEDPEQSTPLRAFAFPGAIPFDTRAQGGAEVTIGSAGSELPSGIEGLAIYTFDATNPTESFRLLTTSGVSRGASSPRGLQWSSLASTLSTVGDGTGTVVASTGTKSLSGYEEEPEAAGFKDFLEQLERLGANPDVFARTVAENGNYSMIATVDELGRGRALESGSAVAEGNALPVAAGRLTGSLLRGPEGVLYPAEGDPSALSESPGLRAVLHEDQVEWPLTPAPEAGGASCQQVAFAYIASQLLPAAALPLWKNQRARACQGLDHTGSSGAERADSLDGDACASEERAAIGALGANVRRVSMALRSTYQSVNTTLSQAEVQDVTVPRGAPFTAADLTCAKNQLIDELSAVAQVEKFIETLAKPQNSLQGKTVVELGQIAENVKTASLASLAGQLRPQSASTAGFWANFAFRALSGIAKSVNFFAAPESTALIKGAQFTIASSEVGAAAFGVLDGPPGNPVANTDEYVLLASQLDQEAEEVEAQIENLLTAQERGALEAEAAILSDPGRLANVDDRAKGDWKVSAEGLERAQQAYTVRVRQLAYEDFMPQLFEALRFNYAESVQLGEEDRLEAIWRDGAWHAYFSNYQPFVENGPSDTLCGAANGGYWEAMGDTDLGTLPGLGAGNEYRPPVGVAVAGASPSYLDYVLLRAGQVGATHELYEATPTPADPAILAPLFAQFGAAGIEEPAGFYPPEFWFRDLDLGTVVQCGFPYEGPVLETRSPEGGPYGSIGDGDVWPTPVNEVVERWE